MPLSSSIEALSGADRGAAAESALQLFIVGRAGKAAASVRRWEADNPSCDDKLTAARQGTLGPEPRRFKGRLSELRERELAL